MALDIDSLLELELQHTEDTEHRMDLTPPELEPTASGPADPSPHNAPPRPPPPDMTAYVESVEDPEQDTVLSLLAYHSWRWGHQVTLHRPQDGPHQWSPEQTAKWDIVLHLSTEGFYILMHSRLPDATPNAQALPLAEPQEDVADAPPPGGM